MQYASFGGKELERRLNGISFGFRVWLWRVLQFELLFGVNEVTHYIRWWIATNLFSE